MSGSLRLVAPRNIFRTVTPSRRPNGELRAREYLSAAEVERLMKAARSGGRHGHRDATMILTAYRHGLRASEVADLEWSQVELAREATLHVRRAKNGKPSAHPLRGDEVRGAARAAAAIPGLGLRVRQRIGESGGFAIVRRILQLCCAIARRRLHSPACRPFVIEVE